MRVIVIGGVAAGASVAAKARREIKDGEIVVYEKTDTVSFGACGLPYYIGNCFSDPNFMIARTVEDFKETGVEIKTFNEVKEVDFLNKKIKIKDLKNNRVYEDKYDKLVIATGSIPIIPPIKNIELENVFTLKTLEDGLKLKGKLLSDEIKDITIVGAGYIGLELADTMSKLGKNIRIIQLDEDIMPESFDKEMTEIMKEELSNKSIDLKLNEYVVELGGDKKVQRVITNKGEYNADLVVIATGVKPNTSFLDKDEIELMNNGAIKVDNFGRTNIDDVYAVGDCAAIPHFVLEDNVYMALATSANKLGRIIGENLGGNKSKYPGTLGTAGLKLLDLECARTGITEKLAKELGYDYKQVFIKDKNQTNYYPGQEDIFIKLIYDKNSKKILGGQIVGKKGAALRINTLAAAIYNGMTTKELGMLDLLYSPPFARTWDVLNLAGNVAK